MPRPAEIEVEECAAPNGSNSLRAFGESGKSAALAQGPDAVAPVGQYLVRVGLMPHIPDQTVPRSIEDIMQRDGELDDAQPGTQVAAGDGHRTDGLRAQFIGHLPQRFLRQTTQMVWNFPPNDATVTVKKLCRWGNTYFRSGVPSAGDRCAIAAVPDRGLP
jgi:hypothetical protein